MAPLPANSTPRFKVFYTNAGQQHVMDIRSHDSPAAFGSNVNTVFNGLGSTVLQTTLDFVEFAADGSNVFNLVVTGFEGTVYGTGAGSLASPSQYVNFIGRSGDGRRVRLMVLGMASVPGDFRWSAGDSAAIDNVITSLNSAANHFVTIGDIKPVWKSYANAGYNAYWQKQIRP